MKTFHNSLILFALIILSWHGYKLLQSNSERNAITKLMIEQEGELKATNQHVNDLTGGRLQGIDALRRAFARLDTRMSSFETQLQQLANMKAVESLDSDDEATEAEANLSKEESAMQEQQEKIATEKRMEKIESSFRGEEQDNSWTQATSNALYKSFESKEINSTSLIDLECRSTLCRIEVDHKNFDDQEDFDLNFGVDLADTFSKFTISRTENEDGSSSTVMYAFRED